MQTLMASKLRVAHKETKNPCERPSQRPIAQQTANLTQPEIRATNYGLSTAKKNPDNYMVKDNGTTNQKLDTA